MPRRPKPKAPRPKGAGGLYQRKSDGRFVGALRLPPDPATGKVKVKVFYGDTREQAEAKLIEAQLALASGTLPTPSKMSLGEWLAHWLDNVAATRVRPRVLVRYRELAAHARALHPIPIQKVKASDLQRLYRAKLRPEGGGKADGLAPRSVGAIHRLLHGALEDALRSDVVARNVAGLVSPPRVPSVPQVGLTPAQARALLERAAGDTYEALYVLALSTGARLGELLGLRWSRVDLERGGITIDAALVSPSRGPAHLAEPKTASSRRHVPLFPGALAALRRHRTRQAAARLRAGPAWREQDLVFCSEIGTYAHPTNIRQRSWAKIRQAAGLPASVRIHDLRHSAATFLLAEQVPLADVSKILGHSGVAVTARFYLYDQPDTHRAALEKLGNLLEGTS